MSEIEKLNEVLISLKAGGAAPSVTIREFLNWFGVQRRTSSNVEYINERLADIGICTVPNYLNDWIDTEIGFGLTGTDPKGTHMDAPFSDVQSSSQEDENRELKISDRTSVDPSYRIGKILSANNPPVYVNPDASLLEAKTLMLAGNFSQLPVMTTDREVKGVVSWESIGARIIGGTAAPDVRSYMETRHYEVPPTESLFVVIKMIVDHNYVLIRAPDNKISGIVTATDIALQFEEISTPFLLLAEIENSIRAIISRKLDVDDVKRSCDAEHLPQNFARISELSNYPPPPCHGRGSLNPWRDGPQ